MFLILKLFLSLLDQRHGQSPVLDVFVGVEPDPNSQSLFSPRHPVYAPGQGVLEGVSVEASHSLSMRNGLSRSHFAGGRTFDLNQSRAQIKTIATKQHARLRASSSLVSVLGRRHADGYYGEHGGTQQISRRFPH